MAKFTDRLSHWAVEWGIKGNEVSQIDGIALIDIRKRGGSFQTTIENALSLIRQYDPRRYVRVVRYISRIVNVTLPSGSLTQYDFSTRTVNFEFREMPKNTEDERTALYACFLVAAATQGILESREIEIDQENRIRARRLYVAEHNRFVEKLSSADPLRYPSDFLRVEFNEIAKRKTGNKKFLMRLLSVFSVFWRAASERKIKGK